MGGRVDRWMDEGTDGWMVVGRTDDLMDGW